MNPIVLIPARMASTRLPGKPLADIGGRPMIVRVAEQGRAAGLGPVVIAAGDVEIAEAAHAHGFEAVLTDPELPSGSDRVMAALEAVDPAGAHDVVVNLQGDMPTISPGAIAAAVEALAADPGADIATLVVATDDPAERDDPNVVKAVVALAESARRGRALYFTRAPAPAGPGPVLHHVGLYVYRRDALARFTALPPSPLEGRERLEQLRALENGMVIAAAVIEESPLGVDSPADLEAVRAIYAARAG